MADTTKGSTMQRGEHGGWLRFAGSLLALAAVAAAVPVGLVRASRSRFGSANPWSGVAPPWHWQLDGVSAVLEGRMADSNIAEAVVRLSITVVWCAIALLLATVLVEIVHQTRHDGIPTPTVRGLGWSQGIARFIATGLLVMAPHLGMVRASTGTTTLAMPTASTTLQHEDPIIHFTPPARSVPTPVPSSTPTPDTLLEYVVQPGDSVYAIAARLAPSDQRVAAGLADAIVQINLGRTMSDGQRFTNAALLEPGWTLRLPPTAPLPLTVVTHPPASIHEVAAGDTLWAIAREHLDDPHRWTDIWTHNAGAEMVAGRTFDDPHLIVEGWRLEIPRDGDDSAESHDHAELIEVPVIEVPVIEVPVADEDAGAGREIIWDTDAALDPGESPVVEPGVGDPTPTTLSPPLSPADAAVPVVPSGAEGEHDVQVTFDRSRPLGIEHAAMLSAGILTVVAVHRRRRLRGSAVRTRVPEPAPGPVRTERMLRSLDASERLLRIDLALRCAASTLADRERAVVAAFVATNGAVELLLSGPSDLPGPWEGSGTRWKLSAVVPIEVLATAARSVGAPCVALVEVGTAADGRSLYLDLEAIGHLAVSARAERADAVVRSLAATIGSSVFAEVAHLIGVGLGREVFMGHRSAETAGSLSEALETAAALVGSIAAGTESTFALRSRASSGETWEPAIVFTDSSKSDQVGTVRPSSGLVVVATSADGCAGAGATLVDRGDRWELSGPVLGDEVIELVPLGLDEHEAASLAALLADAQSPLPVESGGEPDSELVDPARSTPEWSLMVRLLGPVDLVDRSGNTASFERSKTKELIAWLATHRRRSTRSAARTALWELDVRDATFANVVSEARRTMARLVPTSDGVEWLARTLTQELPLHPEVVTDADLLEFALDAARLHPPETAIDILDPAVDLIRGLPFEGTSYLWPDADGITSNLVLLATSAAVELAAHHLALGDIEGVFRATAHGLRVLPGHEELIAMRMRAHARAGDHAGVRHEWESYERVITADTWSDGEPAPKLVSLRHELLSTPA